MTMRKPKTLREWVTTVAAAVAIVATVGGGIYSLHSANAYSADLHQLEADLTQGLEAWTEKQKSKQCSQWLSEITMLESREARNELTDGQRDRLIWLRNTYEAECSGGYSG